MRPPRHMLPNAPWPERLVPPPLTRGIRATARPVPHDSADVWCPIKQADHEVSYRQNILQFCAVI